MIDIQRLAKAMTKAGLIPADAGTAWTKNVAAAYRGNALKEGSAMGQPVYESQLPPKLRQAYLALDESNEVEAPAPEEVQEEAEVEIENEEVLEEVEEQMEEESQNSDDLESMTRQELLDMADDLEVTGRSQMKKAELVEAIRAARG